MKFKLTFLLIFFVATFTTSAQDEERSFDLGVVEDGVYTNNFFKFNLSIPEGWDSKIDKDQKLAKKTFDNLSEDNPGKTDWIDAARVKTAILVVITKYQAGAAVSFNPNIVILVENVSDFPGVKTGADYLFQAMKLFETTTAKTKTKVKGKEFERHDFSRVFYSAALVTKVAGTKVKQKMFCTIVDGFCLLMSCSYQTEAEFLELYDVMSSIEFED